MRIADRLDRLERDNRRLKTVVGVLLTALAGMTLLGSAGTPDTITAKRFVVVDGDGKTLIEVGAKWPNLPGVPVPGTTGIVVHGKTRDAGVQIWGNLLDGPSVRVGNAKGSIELHADVEFGPDVTLFGAEERMANLAPTDLEFSGKEGEPSLQLVWDSRARASSLHVKDDDDKPLASVQLDAKGRTALQPGAGGK